MSLQLRHRLEHHARANAGCYSTGDGRLVARVLGDMKMVLDARDMSLTPHLALDGFWESWITAWLQTNIRPDDRLLNIGANCGYYALMCAVRGLNVVAVEPQVHLAENLRLSASLNGCEDRLVVEPCVAGAANGEVPMQAHRDYQGSAYVGESKGTKVGWAEQLVEERVATELMPDATCVFVDAEGFEPQIWEGLKPLLDRRQLRWVALEWAPRRYADPYAFLQSLGEYGPLSVICEDGSEDVTVPNAELLRGSSDWDTVVVRCG